MSDATEGLGGAIEAGLAGRSVEANNGTAHNGDAVGHGPCLNCGTTGLIGPYCHNCGQQVHIHRSMAAIGHDLMHGVLHLDGKLWRTLPLLTLKPGQLTRRYIAGERTKFVSPMAMFLFSVFMMFAVFQMVGLTTPTTIDPVPSGAEAKVEGIVTDFDVERANLEKQLAELPPDDPARPGLEQDLEAVIIAQEKAQQAKQFILGGNDSAQRSFGADIGVPLFDKALNKWRDNPGLMLYKLQANGYKFSWLLIPLSLPFMWLLFAWRRNYHLYDHAIFVTYSLSFMSLLFIALSILSAAGIGGTWIFMTLAVVPPIHIYKQLRGAYGLSRGSTAWRLCVLSICIAAVLVIFLQALLLIGAF
ncbi:DUF3667 domain-containing protein [Erythrobacteraceae bacterium E2-1 Yellow Sea]|nr:DUF3667 domain-containing protein [Erythrobacteraceae bacterium E2-1 Yellow Sea]